MVVKEVLSQKAANKSSKGFLFKGGFITGYTYASYFII